MSKLRENFEVVTGVFLRVVIKVFHLVYSKFQFLVLVAVGAHLCKR